MSHFVILTSEGNMKFVVWRLRFFRDEASDNQKSLLKQAAENTWVAFDEIR